MDEVKIIEIKKSVFEDNDKDANNLRNELKEKGIFLLNVMSSPGSGKTSTLIKLINRIKNKVKVAVMEADIDSDVDDKRKNLKNVSQRKDATLKHGFCAGFIFAKRELMTYQDELKRYVNSYFDNKLTFGEMKKKEYFELNAMKGLNIKLNDTINQYQDVIKTHTELFTEKYKDNDKVLADYKTTYYQAFQSVGKKSPTHSLFARVREFFLKILISNKISSINKNRKHNNISKSSLDSQNNNQPLLR